MSLSTNSKLALIYSSAIIITLIIAEGYFSGWFSIGDSTKVLKAKIEVISGESFQQHEILGFSPAPNSEYLVRKFYGDSLLYQSTQTINEFSLRAINSSDTLSTLKTALFFGGSYTFGEGVENNETSSSVFQQQSDGEFQAINYGYIGYGPHQTLALLENSLEVESLGDRTPILGILQIIPDHIYRVDNKSGWDFFGPEYILSKESDDVELKGAFNGFVVGKIKSLIFQSNLVKSIFYNNRSYTDDSIELTGKIIKRSSTIFEKRYGANFYVILWQENELESGLYNEILSELNRQNLRVIEIKSILPDYYPNSPEYFIPFDNHPNSKAHQLLGEYLVELANSQ